VTDDGGVPLSHQPLNGDVAEARTHVANLRLQRYLLHLLGLRVNDLRTFKRRCVNSPPENSPAECGT
jgi:hypothetical protein